MIVFGVERFADALPDMRKLWSAHYAEAAVHKAALPLDMDVARYEAVDEAGALLVVTARAQGVLVGYVVALLGTHLHCRTVQQAVCDLLYVVPSARGGRTAKRLLETFELAARQRGAARIMMGIPVTTQQDRLMAALGYKPIEITFAKLIGEAA